MSFGECFGRLLFIVKIFVRYNAMRIIHTFFNTLNSFSLFWKCENCWPYRLIHFTSLLSAAVCQVRYVLILQIWENAYRTTVSTVHYRSIWGEIARTRTAGPAAFWCSEPLSESVTAINERRPTPSLSFLPSNYRAPSCQCARLLHQLTSTRKRRLNLRATISWPAKHRARSIAISDCAYMSPCVARVYVEHV